MGKLIYTVLTFILGSAFKRILIGAGLGIISSNFIISLINSYISNATSNINIGNSLILAFLHISGADVCLSVLVGALVTRATIQATSLSLKKLA